jgi:hypothetical protein
VSLPAHDESFEERAERLSAEWRARYGVDEESAWTDDQLDHALADAGFPALATLPTEPQGPLRRYAQGLPSDPAVPPAVEARRWQRVNAAHLMAHAMLHDGLRCPGCEAW